MVAGIVADGENENGGPSTAKANRAPGAGEVEIALDKGTVRAVVYAVDTHGNRLAAVGTPDAPLRFEATAPGGGDATPEETPETEFRSYWILTGGLALGLAALGTVAGLSAQQNIDDIERRIVDSENIEYGTEVKPLEDKARRNALVANIAFAAAGAAAVSSVVLYFVLRDDAEGSPTAVGPSFDRDSVGVTAAVEF
jgi:hypothetical protein